jgi:hypothetical protein
MNEPSELPEQTESETKHTLMSDNPNDVFKPIGIEDVVSGQFDQAAEGVISPLITKARIGTAGRVSKIAQSVGASWPRV